jgi:hypothetical protein
MLSRMDRCTECGFDYTAYADEGGPIADTLSGGVAEIAGLVLHGDPAALRTRQKPDVWSAIEYACHVRDVLLVQRERALTALRVPQPSCEPMGRDERVEHDGYAEQMPTDVARQLTDAALMFSNLLARLDAGQWRRTVVYPWPTPTVRSLQWLATHSVHEVEHHLMDVRRQLQG